MNKGVLFIVSAPSGAGKTTLCDMALARLANLENSISYTTRKPREGERDGVEYCFVDEETFLEMETAGQFLESATVHGNRYGTACADLFKFLDQGRDVLVEIDVQGAAQLREKFSDAVFIFILPPSIEACAERLEKRGKDSADVIKTRLKNSIEEIGEAQNYDYIIINEDLNLAYEDFRAVILAEKVKRGRVSARVNELFKTNLL